MLVSVHFNVKHPFIYLKFEVWQLVPLRAHAFTKQDKQVSHVGSMHSIGIKINHLYLEWQKMQRGETNINHAEQGLSFILLKCFHKEKHTIVAEQHSQHQEQRVEWGSVYILLVVSLFHPKCILQEAANESHHYLHNHSSFDVDTDCVTYLK